MFSVIGKDYKTNEFSQSYKHPHEILCWLNQQNIPFKDTHCALFYNFEITFTCIADRNLFMLMYHNQFRIVDGK